MDIRLGNKNDTDGIRKVWEYCFEDGKEYVDFYFEKKFRPENTVVLDTGDNIISSIHLNQHSIKIMEKEFGVSYVVGVSTLPESRGLGIMNGLMESSLHKMLEMEQSISILMPIDFRLYKKFGYENCYDVLLSKLDIFSLKKFKSKGVFKKAKYEDAYDLMFIYNANMKKYNGSSKRNIKYFEDFIEEMCVEGGHIYINYLDGEPTGYISYSISKGVFITRELYYSEYSSFESMLKFIFNHNTQCNKVEMTLPVDSPLIRKLDNPKTDVFEIRPFMMARIINLEKFVDELEIYAIADFWDKFENVVIEIVDDQLLKNNGKFKFYKEAEFLKIKKISDKVDAELCVSDCDIKSTIDCDISMSINEITSVLMSYVSLEEICYESSLYSQKLIDFGEHFKNKKSNHILEYV